MTVPRSYSIATTASGSSFSDTSHVDHLNTPTLVADAQQRTVWKWDQQEPFGVNVPDENPSGLGAFDLPLRLPGQYFDKETNLAYNFFRDYDPNVGRYVESDPIGLVGGINTYGYVEGNPISSTDSFGLIVNAVRLAGGRSQSKSSGKSTNCGPGGCQQAFSECVGKCLDDRLISTVNYASTLAGTLGLYAVGSLPVPGTGATLASVAGGNTGGLIGALTRGAAGAAIGASLGRAAGGAAVGTLGVAAAAAIGYGTGSLLYCTAVCAQDNCYY